MTDKEKIKAEIERLRESSLASESYHDALDDLLVFIDSMHEELVSEDLKKAANKYADNSDYVYADVSIEDFTVETFKAGAKWQFEKVNEALLSEVLPYFMHGGEADEVVAKLDEVLNEKKLED